MSSKPVRSFCKMQSRNSLVVNMGICSLVTELPHEVVGIDLHGIMLLRLIEMHLFFQNICVSNFIQDIEKASVFSGN